MSVPALQDESLTWGVLSFVGPDDSENAFEIEAIADGTHFGNPVPVIETLRSLLIDGAQATVTGWENREVPIRLRITGNDGSALAEAEAALFEQVLLDQPPPLVWTPPLALAAPCAFDTVVARLDRDTSEGWDLDEVLRGDRFFLLTLTCLPFARAMESTVVPALPVPPDPDNAVWVDIDTITGTSGWTRETNGGSPSGPTYTAGPPSSIQITAFIDNANDYLRLVRTGAFTVPAGHYLAVDVTNLIGSNGWLTGQWKARINGTYKNPVAITQDGEGGSNRLFFDNVGAVTELAILNDFENGKGAKAGTTGLRVYNLAYTDTLGASSTTTNRQQSRLVEVLGSAPTQAALRLYDAAPADLGTDILVYTSRNTEWRPNLRRWIDTSVTPSSDSSLISGAKNSLTTPTTFLVPADLLTPGSYALLANVNVAAATTVTWQAQIATEGGATNIVGGAVTISGSVELAATSGFEVVDLAAMILPPVELDSSTTNRTIKLTLSGNSSVVLDEAWLFSLDDGVLTWIRDAEGMDWIEVRSPELGAARPSVWGGRGSVNTDGACIDWKCRSFGPHRFDPGQMQIFTVSSTSLESQAEIEFFPRFHSHVWGEETS